MWAQPCCKLGEHRTRERHSFRSEALTIQLRTKDKHSCCYRKPHKAVVNCLLHSSCVCVYNTCLGEGMWWHEASSGLRIRETRSESCSLCLPSCESLHSESLAKNICWRLFVHITQLQSAGGWQEKGEAWRPPLSCSLNRGSETKQQMTTSSSALALEWVKGSLWLWTYALPASHRDRIYGSIVCNWN